VGLVARPERIEQQLRDGALALRAQYATPFLRELRAAVGLRDLGARDSGRATSGRAAAKQVQAALPVFKQYREADGKFHFKLADGERVLLQSRGFDSPKEAGQRIAALKRDGFAGADADLALGPDADAAAVQAALDALRAAEEAKA
jgi:tryptophanyl-tRNA synthetase